MVLVVHSCTHSCSTISHTGLCPHGPYCSHIIVHRELLRNIRHSPFVNLSTVPHPWIWCTNSESFFTLICPPQAPGGAGPVL